jgi:hypothetical protein
VDFWIHILLVSVIRHLKFKWAQQVSCKLLGSIPILLVAIHGVSYKIWKKQQKPLKSSTHFLMIKTWFQIFVHPPAEMQTCQSLRRFSLLCLDGKALINSPALPRLIPINKKFPKKIAKIVKSGKRSLDEGWIGRMTAAWWICHRQKSPVFYGNE